MRKKYIQNSLIVGSSTLFATLPACFGPVQCAPILASPPETPQPSPNQPTLLNAPCDPPHENSSCDLDQTHTIYCNPDTKTWSRTPTRTARLICNQGTLTPLSIARYECPGVGYTGLTDHSHRTAQPSHILRTHNPAS